MVSDYHSDGYMKDRIEEALKCIDEEQERLTILMNALNYGKLFSIKYISHNIMSSKMSIEFIRSVLTGDKPNYEFKGITFSEPLEIKDEYEENMKKYKSKK